MEDFWNERYSSSDYIYGKEPNPFFKQYIDKNKAGKILLPGEGEGRNAIYAAQINWEVVASDQSIEAQRKAEKLAKQNNLSFDYLVGDITKCQFSEESFDHIAMIFFHLPDSVREAIHNFLISLLKKEGKLFVVGFSTEQLKYSSGGPKDKNMLYSIDLMLKDFKKFKVVRNEQLICNLDEGMGHKGQASLIHFEAIKN